MNMPNAPSPLCLSYSEGEIDSLEHALLKCSTIRPGAELLLEALKSEIPDITLERIRYLDFQTEDLLAPTYLTAATVATLELKIQCQESLLAISTCECGAKYPDAEEVKIQVGCLEGS